MLKFLAISLLSFSMAQAAPKVDGVTTEKTVDGKIAHCGHREDIGSASYRPLWVAAVAEGETINASISIAALNCTETINGYQFLPRKFNEPVALNTLGSDPRMLYVVNQQVVWVDENGSVLGKFEVPNLSMIVAKFPVELTQLLSSEELQSLSEGQTVTKKTEYFIEGSYKPSKHGRTQHMTGGSYFLNFNVALDASGALLITVL